ncbi:MAG TPA: MCE family protein [Nocardioides sp.]|nr:MCE family protein [Nocardioides sp.]
MSRRRAAGPLGRIARIGRTARVALVVLAGCVAVGACSVQPNDHTLPGQVAVGSDGYTVTVRFGQVENLVPNSTVQLDNVVIGTVTSIHARDWQAVVTLRLLRDTPLPADAVFSVGQKTLLGAQYVEVTVPSRGARRPGGQLEDGAVVPASRTGAHPATEQVLGAVALLLNNGGLSQISTITGELSQTFRSRVPDTRRLIARARHVVGLLDANRAQVVSALDALGPLSAGLRHDRVRLADAIDRLAPGLRVLADERRGLVDAVARTGRTSSRAVRLIRSSRAALLADLGSLRPILTELGRVSTAVPDAMKMAFSIPFPAMTSHDAIRGDYFNLFTTLDLRSSGLARLWLGGSPPGLQAGDPLADPLTTAAGSQHQPPGGPAPTTLGGTLQGLLGGLPLGSGDQQTSTTQDQCLLHLLGVC